jgi:hypothetical protein
MIRVDGFQRDDGEGSASGITIRFASDGARLQALDASGRELSNVTLDGFASNPYCCGLDPEDSNACLVAPVVHDVWTDSAGRHLLVRVTTSSGVPDGCEDSRLWIRPLPRSRVEEAR